MERIGVKAKEVLPMEDLSRDDKIDRMMAL
jgi:hypothetical protein